MGTLAALLAGRTHAEPWSIEPRLGVSTDYTSNPQLRVDDAQAEEHVAAFADLPLRFDADDFELLLRPNGRLSDKQGYASLASNYVHFDTSALWTNDRGSAGLQGEVARDSSLYYVGGLVDRVGVPRDSITTTGDWSRLLTERVQLQVDASWLTVRYVDPPDFAAVLTDYRYESAGPTVSYSLTERDTLKISGTYGYYLSLDRVTNSTSQNLQVGYVHQLTELWTLTTSGGYSRSVNSEKILIGSYLLGTSSSNQDGAVYAAGITRQGQRFSLSAGVSRALQPTGFAYLSNQDSVTVNATYTLSERWDFAAGASWLKEINPRASGQQALLNSQQPEVRLLGGQITANWHWTPQWVVSLSAAQTNQQYGPPTVSAGSTTVSLSLFRQFLRTQF